MYQQNQLLNNLAGTINPFQQNLMGVSGANINGLNNYGNVGITPDFTRDPSFGAGGLAGFAQANVILSPTA